MMRLMAWIVGVIAALALAFVILFPMLRESGWFGNFDCPDPPVLAAGGHPAVALSCAETISYRDTTYYVDCAPMHPSRLGDEFVDEGGDTLFAGAVEIEGVSRSEAFVLLGQPGYCKGDDVILAASERLTRLDAGLMSVPLDAEDPLKLARARAPWVVPGRREYPEVLKVEATLTAQGIEVVNRNRYAWRACDLFQIGDGIDDGWETGEHLDRLDPGASHSWTFSAFDRDNHGIEELTDDYRDEITGKPFIVMCKAPRGYAFGQDVLDE